MTNASDRFGRKPVFIVNAVLVCLSLLLSSWANSLLVFNVLRFFTGMFQQVGTMWLFSIYLFTTCFIIDMACYGDISAFFLYVSFIIWYLMAIFLLFSQQVRLTIWQVIFLSFFVFFFFYLFIFIFSFFFSFHFESLIFHSYIFLSLLNSFQILSFLFYSIFLFFLFSFFNFSFIFSLFPISFYFMIVLHIYILCINTHIHTYVYKYIHTYVYKYCYTYFLSKAVIII